MANARKNKLEDDFFSALQNRDTATARRCIEQGMDPNAQNRDSAIPALFYALWVGSPVAEDLIKAGADANFVDVRKRTALHWAARGGHDKTMMLAIRHQDNINAADHSGYTPLHLAAGHDNASAAILLITHGADTKALDDEYLTPLEGAVEEEASETVFRINALMTALRHTQRTKIAALARHKKPAPLSHM